MSGHATKRINEIYEGLKEKYARSLGAELLPLELLAIKHYLDEVIPAESDDRQGFCEYSAIHRETPHFREPGCVNWKAF